MTTGIGVHPEQLEATPGAASSVVVTVANDLDEPTQFQVRVVGSDTDWSGAPMLTPVVEPGGRTSVEIVVELPLGFPSGHHLLGIEVVPFVNGAASTDQRLRRVADLVVSVGALSGLHAVLEPRTVYGRRAAHTGPRTLKTIFHRLRFSGGKRGQANISLRNRSYEPMHVTLSASSPGDEVSVRFDRDEVVVPPGHIVGVSAKVRAPRPFFGYPRRTPFTVQAQGRGSTVYLEGSYSRTAHIRPGTIKGIGVLTVLALWASSLAVIYERVTADDEPEQATAQQASETGEDGDGGGGNGDGSGSSGQGSGEGGIQDLSVVPASVEASGQVTAREPADVRVRVRSVSLVDDISPNAIFQTGPLGSTSRGSKLFGRRISMVHNRIVPIELATTTDEEGRWAVGGLEGPGFFEIRFSKPGYATRAYVVEVPEDGSPIVLDTDLEAGDGAISGVVLGPDGPMGGVDITVTDGTVTFTTRTPTTGNVGQWSVEGLTTPGSYLVTASRHGFGTATSLVRLSGGESARGVQIQMREGTGAIIGSVRSGGNPLGDITVTATDGEVTRTATSLTEDPKGTFVLPDLPSPGIYTLTIEGEGWVSQTRDIALTGGEARVDIEMTASTGIVYGRITNTAGEPLAGVGITAISEDHLYKNTTNPDGRFELVGLEPGSYVLEFVEFEHHTGSSLVTIGAGTLREVNLSLTPRDTLEPPPNNSLTFSFAAEGDITIRERTTGAEASTAGGSTAVFTNLPAGMRTFDITGVGFQPAVVQFRMGLNGPFSTSVTLRPLVIVDMTVRERAFQQAPIGGASVVIRRADTIACPPTNVTPGCQPFVGESSTDSDSPNYGKVFDENGKPPELTDGQWIAITTIEGYALGEVPFNTSYDTSPITSVEIPVDRLGEIRLEVIEPRLDAASTDDITFERLHGVTITIVGGPQDGRVFTELTQSPYVLTRLAPGEYRFLLERPGYRSAVIPATPISVNLNDVIEETAVLVPVPDATHGEVMWDIDRRAGHDDPDDLVPVPNAEVRVTGIASFEAGVFGDATEVIGTWPPAGEFNLTNASGQFSFAGDAGPIFGEAEVSIPYVRSSATYAADGFVPDTFPGLPAADDVGTLVLEPRNTYVEGMVVLEYGESSALINVGDAMSRVELTILEGPTDDAPTHLTAFTAGLLTPDAVGVAFNMDDAPAGRYTMRARYNPGPGDPLRFTELVFDVVVGPVIHIIPAKRLEAKGSVSGTITAIPAGQDPVASPDENDTPLGGATVRLLDQAGNIVLDPSGAPREVVLGSGVSTYTFDELDPGTYQIEAERDGYTLDLMPELSTFTIGVGTLEVQNVIFRPLAKVRFQVRGELVGGGTQLLDDDVNVSATQAGSDDRIEVRWIDDPNGGWWEITGLDESTRGNPVIIELEAEGYIPRTIYLAPDGTIDPDIDPLDVYPPLNWGDDVELDPILDLEQLPATLNLTILNQHDQVVEDLTIEVYGVGPDPVATLADGGFTPGAGVGEYSIELPPGCYRLEFDGFNHAPLTLPVELCWNLAAGSTRSEPVAMINMQSTVEGVVSLVAGGIPLDDHSDVSVQLVDADGQVVTNIDGNALVDLTDDDGSFAISGVDDGDSYYLKVSKEGFAADDYSDTPIVVNPIVVGGDRRVDANAVVGAITLQAIPHDDVRITVRSAVGNQLLEGVEVQLVPRDCPDDATNPASQTAPSLTDEIGVATFDAVVPGCYSIEVDGSDTGHNSASQNLDLPPGELTAIERSATVTIQEALLEIPVSISGSSTPDAPTIGLVELTITPAGANNPIEEVTFTEQVPPTNSASYSIFVPATTNTGYHLRAWVPSPAGRTYLDALYTLEVSAGSEPAIPTLGVVEAASVTVQVVEATTGDEVPGTTLTYAGASQGSLTDTPGTGTFQLTGLPPGDYDFSVAARDDDGHGAGSASDVTLVSGANDAVVIEVDAYGRVHINPSSGGQGVSFQVILIPTTDEDGAIGPVSLHDNGAANRTVHNVPTGSYTVRVCKPNFSFVGGAWTCPVGSFAGEVTDVTVERDETASHNVTITLIEPPEDDD